MTFRPEYGQPCFSTAREWLEFDDFFDESLTRYLAG